MAEHVAIHLPRQVFTPKFYPLLREEDHRYLVLYGGAGSGKSVFAAQRFFVPAPVPALCNLLVVRAVAATHRDSTYALFRQIMAQWGVSQLFTCRETDLRVTCKNGNMAVFKGLDDREKLKSITFTRGGAHRHLGGGGLPDQPGWISTSWTCACGVGPPPSRWCSPSTPSPPSTG